MRAYLLGLFFLLIFSAVIIFLIPDDTFIPSEKIWLYGEIAVLTLLSILVYILGRSSRSTDDAYLKVQSAYVQTISKFIIIASFIAAYMWTHKGNVDRLLVYAMLLIYLCFHIFITYFSLKKAKVSQNGA